MISVEGIRYDNKDVGTRIKVNYKESMMYTTSWIGTNCHTENTVEQVGKDFLTDL